MNRRKGVCHAPRARGSGLVVAFAVWAYPLLAAQPAAAPPSRLVKVENKGMLIRECTLPGETRADDVAPGQVAAVQASRDRWLLVYATRGWRGVDDERSIVYQLRRSGPDGTVVKEGFLARSVNDWEPLGDGVRCVKQHGHPVVCGVPKGASVAGKPAANANLFVAKWRVVGVPYDPVRKAVLRDRGGLLAKTQAVQWVQFRLNPAESDIEIVQPARVLRQKGYETGAAFCSVKAAWMNQSFVPPVPFNAACTEWADVNHFDGGRIAALKLAFNPMAGRYEWTETGPTAGDAANPLSEASLARAGGSWVVAVRVAKGVAWARTDDPFMRLPPPVAEKVPATDAPLTAFTSPMASCGSSLATSTPRRAIAAATRSLAGTYVPARTASRLTGDDSFLTP